MIVAVGEDPVGHPDATRVELFSETAMRAAEYGDLIDKFFVWVLKRLGPSGAFIRPVVIVEGRHRETIVHALESGGAAAVVV